MKSRFLNREMRVGLEKDSNINRMTNTTMRKLKFKNNRGHHIKLQEAKGKIRRDKARTPMLSMKMRSITTTVKRLTRLV
jgi:hypothetical protein